MENFLEKKEILLSKNITPASFQSKDGLFLSLSWITNCRASDVLNIRNADHVLRSLGNQEKITLENHSKFIMQYSQDNRLDFIIKENIHNNYIGGVNLVKTNIGWEIGKYIGNKNFEKRGIAKRATQSFIRFISEEFKFISRIYSKTKIKNINNIKLNEILGFRKERVLDEEFILMKKIL